MALIFKPPPGWGTVEDYKALVLEVAEWTWGTAQGAFNEKASASQIIVDAVIGFFPIVGEITACRDLIAVVLGLCNEPRKRKEVLQWVLLVILVVALIPVFGDIVKGVGRLLLKFLREAAELADAAAKVAKFEALARDMIALLNRLGVGNAEKWLLSLSFSKLAPTIKSQFNRVLTAIERVLRASFRYGSSILPSSLGARGKKLVKDIEELRNIGPKQIDEAVELLDETLVEVQARIDAKGATTSQKTAQEVVPGKAEPTYTDELSMVDTNGAVRSERGGWKANDGSSLNPKLDEAYTPKEGYPNIKGYSWEADDVTYYPNIATFSGKITNRTLKPGETIYRVFGIHGSATKVIYDRSGKIQELTGIRVTGTFVSNNFPIRAPGSTKVYPNVWGVGKVPETAEVWRKSAAVLDEWNHNGYIVVGRVLDSAVGDNSVKACTGMIAEQTGRAKSFQYLEGGGQQGFLEFGQELSDEIYRMSEEVVRSGSPVKKRIGHIEWEVRATGWDDVNGHQGYPAFQEFPDPHLERLQTQEIRTKVPQNAD